MKEHPISDSTQFPHSKSAAQIEHPEWVNATGFVFGIISQLHPNNLHAKLAHGRKNAVKSEHNWDCSTGLIEFSQILREREINVLLVFLEDEHGFLCSEIVEKSISLQ